MVDKSLLLKFYLFYVCWVNFIWHFNIQQKLTAIFKKRNQPFSSGQSINVMLFSELNGHVFKDGQRVNTRSNKKSRTFPDYSHRVKNVFQERGKYFMIVNKVWRRTRVTQCHDLLSSYMYFTEKKMGDEIWILLFFCELVHAHAYMYLSFIWSFIIIMIYYTPRNEMRKAECVWPSVIPSVLFFLSAHFL